MTTRHGSHGRQRRKNRRAPCHFCEEVSELVPMAHRGWTVHACRECYAELVHAIIPRLGPVNFAGRPALELLGDLQYNGATSTRQIGEV